MTNERLNSRSKQSRVQPALRMAQDLVSGAEAAGSFQIAILQLLGERANVIVQPGEKLLSVRVPDWDRPHAGTDNAERRLVQIHRHGLRWLTSRRGRQCSKDGSVVPFSNSGHWPVVSGR